MWFATDRSPREPASRIEGGWTAILPGDLATPGGPVSLELRVGGEDASGHAWSVASPGLTLLALHPALAAGTPDPAARGAEVSPAWRLPRGGAFESACVVATAAGPAGAGGELRPAGAEVAILPASMPLRLPATLTFALPDSASSEHVAIFHHDGTEWDFTGRDYDPVTRRFTAQSRSLGPFALLEDTRGPAVTLRRVPRHARRARYNRWALESKLADAGSGVDPRATHFVVGGRARPSEWDGEVGTLRWRPVRRPARGSYDYEVVAVDRTGNLTRRRGTFVIN